MVAETSIRPMRPVKTWELGLAVVIILSIFTDSCEMTKLAANNPRLEAVVPVLATEVLTREALRATL
jgi:hypothetical protein